MAQTLATSLSISGRDINSDYKELTRSFNISDSSRVDITRVNNIPTGSEQTLFTFGSTEGNGVANSSTFDYAIIINEDTTNFVRLRCKDDAAHAFDVKLKAKRWFKLDSRSLNVSETSASFSAFTNIDTVAAQADTAVVDLTVILVHT